MSDGWGTDSTPDWTALAERHEQEQSRRKRLRTAGAVAAAVLAVGGITATAVALGSHGKGDTGSADRLAVDATSAPSDTPATDPAPETSSAAPSGSGSPSASASSAAPSTSKSTRPSPTATTTGPAAPPPPADPLTVISSAATDTAPLSPATLFPAATLSIDGKTWTRLVDGSTTTCYQATTGGLGDILAPQGCRALLRVTYVSGTSAVTVGVAVMDTRAQADAANAAYKGQVQGLVKAGSTSYCTSPGCATTHTAIGRYTVYTVAGTTKGGTTADPVATAAAPDLAARTRDQLLARGKR